MYTDKFSSPGMFDSEQLIAPSAFVDERLVLDPFLGIGKGNGFLGLGKKKAGSSDSSSSSDSNSSGSSWSSGGSKGPGISLAGVTSTIGVLGGIAALLPSFGIGSKARINEINATNNGNALLYGIQQGEAEKLAAQTKTMYIVGGGILLVMLIFFIAVKK